MKKIPLKKISQKVKDRIAIAKSGKNKKFFGGYIKAHPKYRDVTDAVLCKCCGAIIRGLIEDERFTDSRMINGQRVIFKRLIFATFPNFTEITIEFDDGSAHSTPSCIKCADGLRERPEDLEDLYAADLDQMEKEEKQGDQVNWKVYENRKPIKLAKRK